MASGHRSGSGQPATSAIRSCEIPMRYCNQCHRITPGEPLFCNFCGRSYDFKLCPHRHPNPRNAEICSQCGSRELSTPHPRVPLWLAPLLVLLVGASRLAAARRHGPVPDRLRQRPGQQSAAPVSVHACWPDAGLPLVPCTCTCRTSCGDSFPDCSTVPIETTMATKLPNSKIKRSSASAPKARVAQARKPAHLRAFPPLSLGQCWPGHWPGQPGPNLRPPGANFRAARLGPARAGAGARRASFHRPGGVPHRLLALDRKADPHSPRASALPVQGQRQIDLLSGSSHSLDRKPTTRRKNDKVSLFKRGNVWWSYFYEGRYPPPVFHRDFQPQAGRNHRSQAQGGSQQPALPDRSGRSEHDVRRTGGAFHRQRLGPPASSVSPQVPAAVLLRHPRAAADQVAGRRVPAACGQVHQGRHGQPGLERSAAHSLLGRRRATPDGQSAGSPEDGPRAAHPAAGS